MADEFTDSEDERAVKDVLSQAMDHSMLEQLAAINCSSFSTSDNLPSNLEARFRKLKSLPTTTTTTAGDSSRFPPSKSKSLEADFKQIPDLKEKSNRNSNSELEQKSKTVTRTSKSRSDSWSLSSPESESGAGRHRSPDEDSEDDNKGSYLKSKSKPKPKSDFSKRKDLKSKSKLFSHRSDSWTLSSPESESGSVSPPRRSIGCLWCSPKRKQGKENRLSSSSSLGKEYKYDYDFDNDVEFLKTFSIKEQEKMMKQAKKEEEKINKEAQKIVKWAKQASARMMDVSALHDELNDHPKY